MSVFCKNLTRLIYSILEGEDSIRPDESKLRRVVSSEEGLMSWATLVAVVCFVSLIAIVFNVGRISNDKLEAQNAADSVAYSTSLVQARSMNALCATNHMMGELTALYVMHHAIGGKVLDEGKKKSPPFFLSKFVLNAAYYGTLVYSLGTLWVGGSTPESLGDVDSTPRGEATVYDAACLLKFHMLGAYGMHAAGSTKIYKGIATSWFFGAGAALIAAGIATQRAANALMKKIKQEYKFIRALESFALGIRSMKPAMKALLKGLNFYADANVKFLSKKGAKDAAEFIAKKNSCVGEVLGRPGNVIPGQLVGASVSLPVVEAKSKTEKKSQLIRATYPWVREWRSKILMLFDAVATMSRAARFYEYHSDKYTYEKCKEFRKEGLKLYVMEGMNPLKKDKGREKWTKLEGTADADWMFCVVGLARQKQRPAMTHMHILPRTNPKPIMGMAQLMLYNANPQEPHRSQLSSGGMFGFLKLKKKSQPKVGWDTLNWVKGAAEWKNGKPYMNVGSYFRWFTGLWVFMDVPFLYPPDYAPDTPKIKLNWQAKLVPIADKHLFLRLVLVKDSDNRARFVQQVLPGAVVQRLGYGSQRLEMINH